MISVFVPHSFGNTAYDWLIACLIISCTFFRALAGERRPDSLAQATRSTEGQRYSLVASNQRDGWLRTSCNVQRRAVRLAARWE
jgi:hypothetical protein